MSIRPAISLKAAVKRDCGCRPMSWSRTPGLKSITDLKDHAEVFAEMSNPDVGRIYGGPPGWGSEVIINNLYTALGLENDYELFSPGSGANLKAAFARKASQGKPIVGYYWSPTDVVGKYNLRLLKTPKFEADKFTCLTDKNCANPQVTGWKKGEVAVAVVQKLADKAPNVAEFLGKFQFPNATVNKILAWGDDNSASPEDLALHFFKTEEAIWTSGCRLTWPERSGRHSSPAPIQRWNNAIPPLFFILFGSAAMADNFPELIDTRDLRIAIDEYFDWIVATWGEQLEITFLPVLKLLNAFENLFLWTPWM